MKGAFGFYVNEIRATPTALRSTMRFGARRCGVEGVDHVSIGPGPRSVIATVNASGFCQRIIVKTENPHGLMLAMADHLMGAAIPVQFQMEHVMV